METAKDVEWGIVKRASTAEQGRLGWKSCLWFLRKWPWSSFQSLWLTYISYKHNIPCFVQSSIVLVCYWLFFLRNSFIFFKRKMYLLLHWAVKLIYIFLMTHQPAHSVSNIICSKPIYLLTLTWFSFCHYFMFCSAVWTLNGWWTASKLISVGDVARR